MKATKNIDIYLIGKRPVKPIDVVQYDTGIQLVFTVKDFTIPSGATAKLYVQKPSGKFVYQEKNITIANGAITVDLENQALTEYGRTPYQMTISSGSDTVTSFAGLMIVERSLKDAGAVESTSVIKAFDEVTADKIAEFQASAKAIADAVIETIPEDYTELSAKVNESANAIKGHLSGAVVAADDVSPVEHLMNVKVHGKNLFNPNYLTGTKSLDALSTWGNIIVDKPATAKMLKPNTTYTMSFTAECVEKVEYATFQFAGIGMTLYNNGEEVNIGRFWSVDENDWLSLGEKINFTRTFTTPANMDGWVIMCYTQRALDSGGNAVTNILKFTNLQVEEGETATEYEAWVEPSTFTVRRCGKNLLKNTLTTSSSSCGVNVTVGADGSIMFTGTSTEVHGIGINASIKLADGKYILTGGFSNLYLTFWGNSVETGEWVSIGTDRGNGIEVEANGKLYSHYLAQYQALSNVTYNAKSFPMIRHVSSTDETYETYIAPTEHTPSSDGTVEGITSLSPNMTLLTDTEGVIVECEYNKDTNKVVQKLADALGITI